MSQALNFSVLGSGNGGRAFCGQIAQKGYPVVMYEPLEETADFLKLKEEKKMFLSGDISAGGELTGVTMDIKEAVSEADVIFIVVPSFAHPPAMLAPYSCYRAILSARLTGATLSAARPLSARNRAAAGHRIASGCPAL